MQINWDFLEQKEQTNQVPDIYDLVRQGEEFLAEKQRLSQVLGLDKDPSPSVSSDTKSPMLLNIVNPVITVLDYLSRPSSAVASGFDQFVFGEGEELLPFTESLKQLPKVPGAMWDALKGERRTTFKDVLVKAGWPTEPIIPAFEGIPVLGSSWAGVVGLGLDIGTDPLTYIGISRLNRTGLAAQRSGQLSQLRSAQALRGQRDLVTIAGYGPSSLPGRLGEAARKGTASFYRGFERVGERISQSEDLRPLLNFFTTKGVGPVRAVRERLRAREAEERYLTRQATRKYGRMDREITELANRYELDPEELRQFIVQEAERKLHRTPVLQPEAVSGAIDPSALPGTVDVATDLVAMWREAPMMQYKIRQGDTLSEIAQRFGTTVDDLARLNNIADPNRIRAGQTIEIPAPDDVVRIIDDIKEAQPRRLAAERAAGVQTPEFESERIDYIHRLATEELRASGRLSKEAREFFQSGRPVLSLSHGAQKARTIAPDNYIREINQAAVEGRFKKVWLDADGNVVREGTEGAMPRYVITDTPQAQPALPRVPIFSEDPAVIELARERMSIRAVTSGQALDDLIKTGLEEQWAVKAVDEKHAQDLINAGWRSVQAPRFHDKMKDIFFPKEVAKEINKFVELFEPKHLTKLEQAIKGALNWWKTMTLAPFPEYHMRNLGTGFIKNYYEDLLPGDPAYLEGQLFAILRAADNMAPRMAQADDFYNALAQSKRARIRTKDGKEYTLEQILDWYEAEQLSFGYIQSHFGGRDTAYEALRGSSTPLWQKLNPLSSQSYLVDAGRFFGNFIEDNLRGSLFIKKLKEGYSPHEAANIVRKTHFDYNDIPEWMKTAREWYSPFITWAYKNLPHEIGVLIQNPGKVSRLLSTIRAAETSHGELPDPYTIPSFLLMPVYVGDNEEGQPMYGNILQMWGMTDLVEFSDNPLHYLIGQLHPYFAQPFEQVLNVDTFMNRPIVRPELEAVRKDMIRTGEIPLWSRDWASTTLLGSMQPAGAFNLPARAEHFMRMFRPYSLVSRFMDPDTTTQDALIRTLTGYTTYPANEWFSGPAYFNNAEEAAWYYRTQAILARQKAQEAVERGDTRAAFLHEQEAQKWEQLLEQWLPRFRESLEALER